ncbi:MAG: hypothetical protein AAF492_21490, partial [Verrucomicrobiota bacterium]
MEKICHLLEMGLNWLGVVIILLGGFKSLIGYLRYELGHLFTLKNEEELDGIRGNFGAYLLLGLE